MKSTFSETTTSIKGQTRSRRSQSRRGATGSVRRPPRWLLQKPRLSFGKGRASAGLWSCDARALTPEATAGRSAPVAGNAAMRVTFIVWGFILRVHSSVTPSQGQRNPKPAASSLVWEPNALRGDCRQLEQGASGTFRNEGLWTGAGWGACLPKAKWQLLGSFSSCLVNTGCIIPKF